MTQIRILRISPDYGFHDEHDPTDSEITVAGLAMNGDIVMGGNEVTGLPATPSATGAASKEYVDNLISGMQWRDPVEVRTMIDDASSGPPVSPAAGDAYVVDSATGAWSSFDVGDIVEYDGSAWNLIVADSGNEPPDGTRVLVGPSPGAGGSFNGHANEIATYDATGDTWSFESPSNGWATLIVGDGSFWENTGWVYDSTPGGWIQFSGAGQINAGVGLEKDGNTLNVKLGDGITELPSDYVGIDLTATTPGLELTGTSPDKTLQVQADGAHGIIRGATGLEIEIDDTPDTLDVDSDGLKVVGVPSLFKINDSAVSANVTATNLNTLTAGPTSNADSLHTHAISAVTAAEKVLDTHLNNSAVTAGRAVRWSGTNNEVQHADNQGGTLAQEAANSRCIGVAQSGGAANPGTSDVVKHGLCTSVLTGKTVNTPIFLGNTGNLVEWASIPVPGRVIRLGFMANGTDLDVQIMDLGRRRI